MLHIVSFSTGAASAVCLFRVIDRYGLQNTRAVFADVRNEDPDNYRFFDDCQRVAGLTIDRLTDGRTIWDVFLQHATLTTPGRGCRATWALKQEPLEKYRAALNALGPTTLHIGFTLDEDDRISRLRDKLKNQPLDFPCTWPQPLWRCDLMDFLHERGITPPRLYASGYTHANCGGACILAGIRQWSGVLQDNPTLYATNEEREQAFLALLASRKREPHTILRTRNGNASINYSLKQLREDIESGRRPPDDSWRETSCRCTLGF